MKSDEKTADQITVPQPISTTKSIVKPTKNSIITFGAYDWLVLDVQPTKMLLLSKDCVENQPYHLIYTDITWENCTLRQYLNNEFLDRFPAADQRKIMTTSNDNPSNPWFGTKGGSPTTDKIFLLSLDEAVEYFGDSTAKAQLISRPGTDRWMGSEHFQKEIVAHWGNSPRWWWFRTPGIAVHATGVNTAGIVGASGSRVDNSYGGVRPALWLNLEPIS